MKKGKVKKMLVMVLISILVTVIFVNVYRYIYNGGLESDWNNFKEAVRLNCKGESAWDSYNSMYNDNNITILDKSEKSFLTDKQKDMENAKEYLSKEYNTTENLDAIYMMEYYTIENDIMPVAQMQDTITDNIIAIVVGVVLGLVAFYITEVKVKYNWIKLVIGYFITGILLLLIEIIVRVIQGSYKIIEEIKSIFGFHALEFIAITTIIYIVLIVTNYLVQKRKATVLNNELKNK